MNGFVASTNKCVCFAANQIEDACCTILGANRIYDRLCGGQKLKNCSFDIPRAHLNFAKVDIVFSQNGA